jgi:hypothetical protein
MFLIACSNVTNVMLTVPRAALRAGRASLVRLLMLAR